MLFQSPHFSKEIEKFLRLNFIKKQNLKENYFKKYSWYIFIFYLIWLNLLYYWICLMAQFNWFKRSFLFYLMNFKYWQYRLVFIFSCLNYLSNHLQICNLALFSFEVYLTFKSLFAFHWRQTAFPCFFKLKTDLMHRLKYHSVVLYLYSEEWNFFSYLYIDHFHLEIVLDF